MAFTMIRKSLINMSPTSLGKFDVEDGVKLVAITAISDFTKYYLIKQKIIPDICCRKTAVCIGDQLLDFSVPELVRSQSTPEVPQNCAGFTLCSSAGLAVGECYAVLH